MGRCDRGRSFNLLQMAEEGVSVTEEATSTQPRERQLQNRRSDMQEEK